MRQMNPQHKPHTNKCQDKTTHRAGIRQQRYKTRFNKRCVEYMFWTLKQPWRKKYRLLSYNGSFKEQVPKKVFKYGTPEPSVKHVVLQESVMI